MKLKIRLGQTHFQNCLTSLAPSINQSNDRVISLGISVPPNIKTTNIP